jgi:hypothetical protein
MRFVLMLAVVVTVTACSDRSVVGPEYGRRPCRPSAELVALVTVEPFVPTAMRSALLHGADVMTLAIADGPQRRDLQDAMRFAAADIGVDKLDSACRLIEIADAALTALPDSAASLPDRVGIRLILALTAHSLAAVLGE